MTSVYFNESDDEGDSDPTDFTTYIDPVSLVLVFEVGVESD
jgi:hypothetical protein